MLKRIFAIMHARNLEFIRDRSSLAWSIILPLALVFGLAFIFSDGDRSQFTIGVMHQDIGQVEHPFAQARFVRFVRQDDQATADEKIARHQLDMLIDFSAPTTYWINPSSPKGYVAEKMLQSMGGADAKRAEIDGEAVRYVDWLFPGILGMNMMFSCLFGVGYVVVRYRKNGFLKRLKATPLRAIEFVIAQVASRLLLILAITIGVYVAVSNILDTRMDGSYIALFLVLLIGAVALISLGLLVAARVTSEELAGGLLNMLTWPMMMVSGVWFSLEGANPVIRQLANLSPLTQILTAARAVMLDGAGLTQVAPQLGWLSLMSVVFLAAGASLFRWQQA